MVGAAKRLGTAIEQRVRGDHFGDGQAGSHFFAQLTERTIGDPGHGRDEQIVAKLKTGKFHGRTRGLGQAGKPRILPELAPKK